MKKTLLILFIFLCCNLNIYATNFSISKIANNEVLIAIDSETHIKYGLAYPVTYQFELPVNSSSLYAYKKAKNDDNWSKLTEKTSNDFFNAIEVVRFDYDQNIAYVSVGFSSISDSIFLKLTDNSGINVKAKFVKICNYYDNRKSVVSTTADDLIYQTPGFKKAFVAFRSRNLWLSCGVVTSYIPEREWAELQKQVDSGLLEIDSHSYSHKPHPYPDINLEIAGSKNDIINNLNLPPLFKNGNREYVYCYIYPFGSWASPIDVVTGQNDYLINRTVDIGESNYSNWDPNFSMFFRVGSVYEVGGVYDSFKGVSDINTLKNTFDQVVQNKGIYHFTIHPNDIEEVGDWEKPYMSAHLDYISNRKNIWYVGFGHLYLYHFLAVNIYELNYLSIEPENISLDSYSGTSIISISSNTNWQINENIDWLSVSSTSGNNNENVTLTYEANNGVASRNAEITITAGSLAKTLKVNQVGKKYLEISPTDIKAKSDSSTIELTITSNTNWHFDQNVDWLYLSSTSGDNDEKVTLLIAKNNNINPREADFSITDGVLTKTVIVTQAEKKYLEINPYDIELESDSSSFELTIYSNTNWHFNFIEDVDWFSLSDTSGSMDNKILLSISENPHIASRETSFTLTDSNLTQTISVKQSAKEYLSINPFNIELQSDSSQFDLFIDSSIDWQINNESNWISLSKISGFGVDTIIANYFENTTEKSRTGNIIISGSDISDTVIITQKGVELFTINATPDSVQAGIVEGSGKYKIGKSVSLVAKSNSGWKFNGWYEKQLFVSEDSVFIFVVTCSRELIAKFEQIYTDINFNEPLPDNYNLSQNYPNPFNPTTKIQYSIPSAGQNDILTNNIKLSVYDALGKEVTTLVNEHKSAGTYEVTFNASQLPSGIYYYELIAGNFIQTRKMVLMK